MHRIDCRSLAYICALWIYVSAVAGRSSPLQLQRVYDHSIELEKDVAELWWTVNDAARDILFELHVKTSGWIALGISPGRWRAILRTNRFNFVMMLFFN